jgi:hypothetical protein
VISTKSIEKQTKPIRDLIQHARQRDALGKAKATHVQLIDALMTLGRSRKEAEREVENARVRVRGAANKAEARLESILRDATTWDWTDPRRAIRLMRRREFGHSFEDRPLTDIEQGLVDKGNVLWIIAVYPALKWAIFSRLSRRNEAANIEVSSRGSEPQLRRKGSGTRHPSYPSGE